MCAGLFPMLGLVRQSASFGAGNPRSSGDTRGNRVRDQHRRRRRHYPLALVISNLMQGDKLPRALELADKELRRRDGHEETMQAIDNARMLAGRGRPTPEEVELLGGGWTAEEALAIAICCERPRGSFDADQAG
jgi:hypothetical protein